jgi:biopolymer transport protein ExbD
MKLQPENQLLTMFSFSSLTDIVMLLLIFFLISSSFVVQPGIKVSLPRAETGDKGPQRSVTISLTDKGQIFVNAEQVTLENLGQRLSRDLGEKSDRIVVINADRTVSLQNTVQVIDIAKAVGAERFMIATRPPGDQR